MIGFSLQAGRGEFYRSKPRELRKGAGGGWMIDFSLSFFCPSGKNAVVHPLFAKADKLSSDVIGAAIEVHRLKGPGLIESIYEKCLSRELSLRGISCVSQKVVPIDYKGYLFEELLRFDSLVESCLLLELKCVEKVLPVHKAQLLSYMKLLNIPIGLLFNFHEMKLAEGIVRLILPGANIESI